MLPLALLCVSWFLGIGIDAQTTTAVKRVSNVHLPNQRALPTIRDLVLPP